MPLTPADLRRRIRVWEITRAVAVVDARGNWHVPKGSPLGGRFMRKTLSALREALEGVDDPDTRRRIIESAEQAGIKVPTTIRKTAIPKVTPKKAPAKAAKAAAKKAPSRMTTAEKIEAASQRTGVRVGSRVTAPPGTVGVGTSQGVEGVVRRIDLLFGEPVAVVRREDGTDAAVRLSDLRPTGETAPIPAKAVPKKTALGHAVGDRVYYSPAPGLTRPRLGTVTSVSRRRGEHPTLVLASVRFDDTGKVERVLAADLSSAPPEPRGFPQEAPEGIDPDAWARASDHEKRVRLEWAIRAGEREIRELRENMHASRRWAEALPDDDPRKDLYLRREDRFTLAGEVEKMERELARLEGVRNRLQAVLDAAGDAGREAPAARREPTAQERAAAAAAAAQRRAGEVAQQLDELTDDIARWEGNVFPGNQKLTILDRLTRLERVARELNNEQLVERVALLRQRATAIPSAAEAAEAAAAQRREWHMERTGRVLESIRQRYSGNANDRAILGALAANGWQLVDSSGIGDYTFESPDGQRRLGVITDTQTGRPAFYIPGATGRTTLRAIREHVGAPPSRAAAAVRPPGGGR